MSFDVRQFKARAIASLEGDLNRAFNYLKGMGYYYLADDVGELMYCPVDEFQGIKNQLIKDINSIQE